MPFILPLKGFLNQMTNIPDVHYGAQNIKSSAELCLFQSFVSRNCSAKTKKTNIDVTIYFFLLQAGLKQIKFRSYPYSHFRSHSHSYSFHLLLFSFYKLLVGVPLCLQGGLSSFSCSVSGPALSNVTLTVSLSVFNTCISFSYMSYILFIPFMRQIPSTLSHAKIE